MAALRSPGDSGSPSNLPALEVKGAHGRLRDTQSQMPQVTVPVRPAQGPPSARRETEPTSQPSPAPTPGPRPGVGLESLLKQVREQLRPGGKPGPTRPPETGRASGPQARDPAGRPGGGAFSPLMPVWSHSLSLCVLTQLKQSRPEKFINVKAGQGAREPACRAL